MNKEKETNESEVIDLEVIQEIAETSKELLPQLNVNMTPTENAGLPAPIISDEKLVKTFDEILENTRKDREEISDLLSQFAELVLNGGDATTSSKEALVNLMKLKSDTSDKMAKIADLMSRARGVNTFKPYLTTNQNNTINIGDNIPKKSVLSPEEKRALIEKENKKMEKDKR